MCNRRGSALPGQTPDQSIRQWATGYADAATVRLLAPTEPARPKPARPTSEHGDLHLPETVRPEPSRRECRYPPELVPRFCGWHRTDDSAPYVPPQRDRKSTRLNSSHVAISYAVFCLKKKKN